jgi:predicted nucleic acid-binding Zn ribbon protein
VEIKIRKGEFWREEKIPSGYFFFLKKKRRRRKRNVLIIFSLQIVKSCSTNCGTAMIKKKQRKKKT